MSHASPHRLPARSRRAAPIALSLLIVALVAALAPAPVLGATTTTRAARCDGVSLRTRPRTSAPKRVSLPAGTLVVAVEVVSGGRWRAACDGDRSGSTWLRIRAVDGKSVSSLFGVRYLYGAKGLFRTVTTTMVARCDGVKLRKRPYTSAPRKRTLKAGARVSVVATVRAGSWRATCAGKILSGRRWYRIKAINGKSVRSLYGIRYVYGPKGLFKAPPPDPPPGPSFTEGIDVSHWQGTIDWPQVRVAGKRFAYIKASEDVDFVDWMYATNRAQARSAGLYVGAYHFARPDGTPGDAVAEADHFLDTAAIASGDLLPVLDLEKTGGLSTSALQAWVSGFLGRIYERTGIRGVIYVSPAFWRNYMGDTTWFADSGYSVLWIAHWTTASEPSVPAGDWGGNGWTFWQYTSDGSVPGIDGRVDLDRYSGTDFGPVRVR